MSTYPFKCDLCGGVTELAPTYGDFKCQHCGQVYVYDECHRIELSERQLQTLRDSRWIAVSERLPPDKTVVLAWSGKRVAFGYVSDGNWIDTLYGWFIPNGPSHWMPLPEPPEVK